MQEGQNNNDKNTNRIVKDNILTLKVCWLIHNFNLVLWITWIQKCSTDRRRLSSRMPFFCHHLLVLVLHSVVFFCVSLWSLRLSDWLHNKKLYCDFRQRLWACSQYACPRCIHVHITRLFNYNPCTKGVCVFWDLFSIVVSTTVTNFL